MKIFLTAKFPINDISENLYQELSKIGFEVQCFARDVTTKFDNPRQLMREAEKMINECDILVIDVTEKSWGRSIEAGIAFGGRKKIVVIHKGETPSETVLGIADYVWKYDKIFDLVPKFQALL